MPPPPPQPSPSIELSLRPEELIAAWRPESRRLLLVAPQPLRREQRVVVRVALAGARVAVAITGRVVSASAREGQTHVELAPDETRVRAIERLVEIARGDSVAYPPRAPRYLASLPALVLGPGGLTYMNTVSVSERGCGLVWSGPVPLIGAPMDVRLGAGKQIAAFRGVVCWTAQAGRASTVGVRFVAGHAAAWSTIFHDLRRSGAPPA